MFAKIFTPVTKAAGAIAVVAWIAIAVGTMPVGTHVHMTDEKGAVQMISAERCVGMGLGGFCPKGDVEHECDGEEVVID